MSTVDIQQVRELAETWEIISAMPEDASIDAGLAAVFLGVSDKKLGRIRADKKSGLPYYQYQDEDSTARNQKVYYVKSELRQWREEHKVHSTHEAAVIRGLTFSTMADLLEEQPFVMKTIYSTGKVGMGGKVSKSHSEILGHIFTITDEDLSSLLHDENMEVVWLSLPDALNENWSNGEARNPFHKAYTELLQGWIAESVRGQEAAELNSL